MWVPPFMGSVRRQGLLDVLNAYTILPSPTSLGSFPPGRGAVTGALLSVFVCVGASYSQDAKMLVYDTIGLIVVWYWGLWGEAISCEETEKRCRM